MSAALLRRLRRPPPPLRVERGTVQLGHRRVYILPTRHGMGFALVLLLMLAGSVNYSLSLGFVLTFLLAAMAINGMLYTFRNLANLQVGVGRVEPVFAGTPAVFPLRVGNSGAVARLGLRFVLPGKGEVSCDVPAAGEAVADLAVPTERRGMLRPGRIVVETRYPLGLFRAWSYYTPEAACLVYPAPEPPGANLPPPEPDVDAEQGASPGAGNDDFAGLRSFHPGDSPRHVAWKADARAQGLLTKVFVGQSGERRVWLDWRHLPPSMSLEERIARLARWVLDAERDGWEYGLRLPGVEVDLNSGDAHCARCLETLALHDEHPAA